MGRGLAGENVSEEVLGELGKDLDRLRTVTDRFSKIGSDPELGVADLGRFTGETMAYLERRMPRAGPLTSGFLMSQSRWPSTLPCSAGCSRTSPRTRWTPWKVRGRWGFA